jgi:hypothetical protein
VNRQTRIATVGLAAGLLGGGAVGLVLTVPGLAGASDAPAVQPVDTEPDGTAPADTQPADTEPDGTAPADTDLRPRHEERLRDVLQPLVDDGTLTAEQLDAVVARLGEARPDRGPGHHRGGEGHGPGREGRGRFAASVDAVAEVLGLDHDVLRDELRSGKTLADIAAEQGVEVQAVIDALVAEATSRLDDAVADDRITQEQADERLAELTERVTTMVNEGFPQHD